MRARFEVGLLLLAACATTTSADVRRMSRDGDVDGLVAATQRLRDEPDHREELSAAARRAFDAAYNDAVTLPRFDAIIEDRPFSDPSAGSR
jgi:hypothetical protein